MSKLDGPRKLYDTGGLNRPLDLSLTTEDIEGAQPRKKGFTTKRCVDPLQPVYKLPSFQLQPIAVPADPVGTIPTNFTDDISGCKPRRATRARSDMGRGLDVSDIDYAQPHFRREIRPHQTKQGSGSLDVSDINNAGTRPLGTRETNPLDPVYHISENNMWSRDTTLRSIDIGPIDKGKPRRLIPEKCSSTKGNITGTRPQRYVGALAQSSVGDATIDEWNKPMPTASRAASLKRGIVTLRSTNPLDPNYYMLDGNYDSACRLLI